MKRAQTLARPKRSPTTKSAGGRSKTQHIYVFGGGKADGRADMKQL